MRLRALEWRKRAIWNGTDASSGIDHYEVRADDARALSDISEDSDGETESHDSEASGRSR